MPEVHVCIASDQLLANVIPVLMRKPQRVHLIVSEEKYAKGKALEKFLLKRSIKVETHGNAPDSSLAQILDYAENTALMISENHNLDHIVLNATGGM